MRLFNKIILAATLAAVSSGLAWAVGTTTTIRVRVEIANHTPVSGADVMLVNYGMNGPTSNSTAAVTDATGVYTFTVSTGLSYNLYVNKHGYSPTMRDQFNNPDPSVQRYFWTMPGMPLSSTVTVMNDQVNVGQIRLPFTHATFSKVLFGGVNVMGLQEPGFFGITQSNDTGVGTLTVDNVPYAEANTYNIGIYDPEKNRGINRNVMTALGSGTSPIIFTSADFDNSVPPTRVENNVSQNSGARATDGVEGVIQEVGYSTNTLPHMGINFHYCNPSYGNSTIWANSDDNGRFQLFGLIPGVTYYAEVMGGCSWRQNSGPVGCFAPSRNPGLTQDLCLSNPPPPAPGANDFLYISSADVTYVTLQLARMPRSAGNISVYVKASNGSAIPNSTVNINPDGSPWPKTPTSCQSNNYSDYVSTPGFANANFNATTGYALVDGLPSGNYTINVWTPFSNGGNSNAGFNSGVDGQSPAWGMNMSGGNWMQAHCYGTGVDDYRVTVDTDPATNDGQMLHVYDSSGAPVLDGAGVQLSSITYIIPTGTNHTGLVTGTIKFPGIVDLRETPIMVTLYSQCNSTFSCQGGGNFAPIDGNGAASYTYSVNVASGAAYYMNVSATKWGRINKGGGDNTIHLESTGTAVVNMEFAPAGIVSGTLYKPDGTVFTPANNQYIWIGADNNAGWSNSQLQKDGTFVMSDVLPGINRFRVGSSGGSVGGVTFDYALGLPAPTVNVIAGSTATVNLNLVNATRVGIQFNSAKTPDSSVVMSGSDAMIGFKVLPVSAGTVLNGAAIQKMLSKGGDSGDSVRFNFSPPTDPGTEGPCGQGWPGGFCGDAVPSPVVYDLYLMRSGDFGKMEGTPIPNAPYPHFVMISSSKNVIVDSVHANGLVALPYGGGVSSGVVVNMTPSVDMSDWGNATAKGAVTANNFFRQADFESLGGDFDRFMEYLPLLTLYDENSKFSAAGIVVPSPAFIAVHDQDFNLAFAQGYTAFKNLLDSANGFGYEIRGLRPSKCYTAVLTTPNYPHYQTRICTGVNKSTVTLNIDMDTLVGAGATILGLVKSSATPSVALATATVEIAGEGVEPRTAVTTSTGAFRFEGLSAGTVKIKVTADGYAPATAELDLTGSNIYQQAFFLFPAPGSINGTVYSQKLPFAKVQPGALLYAYDDTYNGTNPTAPLPLLKAVTGSDGTYTINGLVTGHVYKVFLKVPGKYTLNQAVTATAGVVTGVDFTMLPKPLDIEVFARMNTEKDVYEFTVLNPQDFKTGFINWGESPFDPAHVSTVTMTKLNSGELHGEIPLGLLNPTKTYVLQGAALSYSGKSVVREILFGKGYKGNANQNIDNAIIGDDSDDGFGRKSNEAPIDKSGGDFSALSFPPGVLQPVSTGAIPSCTFTGTGKDDASVADKVNALGSDAFAGNLYTVSMSSIATNENKDFELTLAYDKTTANLNDLAVSQYNTTTSKWEEVPGVATINPVKGTVKVKLKKLASVLSVKQAGTAPMGVFDGRQYVVRPQATSSSTSGTFAVVRPSVAGDAFAGSKMKVFNYPNPFSLKLKTVTAHNHDAGNLASLTTNGTFIHVEVPAANGGPCRIRIYTLAGELVNDLSNTCVGGKYNYFEWNGHNKGGQEVANGVYYGVVELSGKAPDLKDATFKMAVIK